jgi:hypothetical protein
MDRATRKFKRPDLVFKSTDKDTDRIKWELVEIACPWPRVDYDGEELEKSYGKKVGKYDTLRHELAQA